ncbi:hypothetical protein GGS20DRAFT_256535 [Poronia punctata]|nr:hypothetical protein GGS20DRAFT_256535 [Poronia punctata]
MADSKNTPNNRRPTTGKGRNSSKKTYASESDIPLHKARTDKPSSPCTPQKSLSPGIPPQQALSTNTKQRNRNKNRGVKNLSPGQGQQGRSPSVHVEDAVAPIFAGSTFHASPAPTSLPIPSFLGRSNTERHVADHGTTAAQDTPPQTDAEESPTGKTAPRHDESPLELFFRADRAEKARVPRVGSANTTFTGTAAFSPPRRLEEDPETSPMAIAVRSAQRPSFPQRNTSPGTCTSGMDGTARLPLGPAFSTPYNERIRAARSYQGPAETTPLASRHLDPNSSEALKRYLFTGHLGGPRDLTWHFDSPQTDDTPGLPHSTYRPYQSAHQHVNPVTEAALHKSPVSTPSRARDIYPSSPPTHYSKQFRASLFGSGHTPRANPAPPILTDRTPWTQANLSSKHIQSEPSARPEHLAALEGDLRRMLNIDPLI